jgi:ribose 5-phosphate isomerase B
VYAGTGLGNAICIDGKILTGNNGVAGELGHIPVLDNENICECGNKGCVEPIVGGKYLDALHSEFSDTPADKIFVAQGNHPLLMQYVRRLAAVVATEVNILDPATVILGGGVISMEGFPVEKLTENIKAYARKPLPSENLRFIISPNTGENGVIGAGICAWEQLSAKPYGKKYRLAVGNDHVALEMKKEIVKHLTAKGHEILDMGTFDDQRCDHPVYGKKTAKAVAEGEADLGILICGTGIGISLAANKVRGIRCAVCSEPYSARLSREHNNTNILAFGARVVGIETAKMMVDCWLEAEFMGGRYKERVDMYE